MNWDKNPYEDAYEDRGYSRRYVHSSIWDDSVWCVRQGQHSAKKTSPKQKTPEEIESAEKNCQIKKQALEKLNEEQRRALGYE